MKGSNVEAHSPPEAAMRLAIMVRCHVGMVLGWMSASDDLLNVPMVVSMTASPADVR